MSYTSNNIKMIMTGPIHLVIKYLFQLVTASLVLLTLSCSTPVQPTVELEVDPTIQQATFKTPEEAANAFGQAVVNHNIDQLRKLLGSDYLEITPLGNVSDQDVKNFIKAWEEYNTLLPQGDKKMLIAVGENKWTFPIPIVAGTSGWYFDIEEGIERIRIRRIGRNELATMQAVLAYYDAQMEYAEQDRNGDYMLEYAQKFISTPGTHDGLYWKVEPDEPLSPLGTLFADHTPGGGYHGYFYKILKAQGKNAQGGAYSYMIGKLMRAGFALIAWPDEYGQSGIMSFIVSHDGIVYEQNLGPDGASIAEKMEIYDPGTDWVPSKEVNAPQKNIEK